MARRLPALLAVLGLASALAVVTAPPTAAAPTQPQTVTFTSTAPVGSDWFGDGGTYYNYAASATASSGLPVSYSIDAASADVCRFGPLLPFPPSAPNSAGIRFLGPGTCTIHADQAGNETYLPAPRATQSFVLEKVQPQLIVLRKTSAPVRQRTFRATLTVPTHLSSMHWGQWGHPDELVTFSVAGHPVCSGTTDGHGVATCTASLSQRDWLRFNFTASYAGDARYKPVSRKGPTFGDKPPSDPFCARC
jgi:hypothetical protein